MIEAEVKVKLDSMDKMVSKLEALGYKKGTTVYELDTYYNGIHEDFRVSDKALRIREHRCLDNGVTKYVLNFKGPKLDDKTMTRQETQFEVPSLEDGETVINGLGFFEAGNVEKTRVHYEKDEVRCCLDTVTSLGDYLEVEIMAESEEKYPEAVAKIEETLLLLGLTMEDTVRHSYLNMIAQNAKNNW